VALFTAMSRILCIVRDETSNSSIVHVWRRAVQMYFLLPTAIISHIDILIK